MIKRRLQNLAALGDYVLGILFLLWVALVLIRQPLAFQFGKFFLSLNGALLIIFLYWIIRRNLASNIIRWSPFVSYFSTFVFIRLLWLSFSQLQRYSSLDQAILNVIFFLFFILFIEILRNNKRQRAWENALISVACVFAVFELLLAYIWYQNWWINSGMWYSIPPIGYRISGGMLEHPNAMSGFLNILIPIVLVRFIMGINKSRKVIFGLILILFLLIQFFTSSRGGWVAGIVGVGVTLILLYFPEIFEGHIFSQVRKIMTPKRIGGLIIIAVTVIIGLFALLSLAESTPGHSGRTDIWLAAIQVWSQNWITGVGTGSFQIVNSQVIQAPPGFVGEHAHNIAIQIGAEYGILGIIMLIMLIFEGWKSWFRGWQHSQPKGRYTMAAYAGVIASALAHGSVDFLFGSILYSTGIILIVSFIVVRDPKYMQGKISSKKFAAIVFIATIGIIVGSWSALGGVEDYYNGIDFGNQGDWKQASVLICKAADDYPNYSFYQFECGVALAQTQRIGNDRISNTQMALEYYKKGLSLDSAWPIHWSNAAILAWQLGDYEQAINLLEHAAKQAPNNSTIQIQMGWMAEASGDYELAEQHYRHSIEMTPWITEGAFMLQTPLRTCILETSAVENDADEVTKLILLAYRDINQGKFIPAELQLRKALKLSPLNASATGLLGITQNALGKPLEGWLLSQQSLLLSENPYTLVWAAQVSADQGKRLERVQLLKAAFEKLSQNDSTVIKYYSGVYNRFFLQVSDVPGIQRADLLPEMISELTWLAMYYAEESEYVMSDNIMDWLNSALETNLEHEELISPSASNNNPKCSE